MTQHAPETGPKRAATRIPWFLLALAALVALSAGYDCLFNHILYQPAIARFRARDYSAAERDFRIYLFFEDDSDAHYYLGLTYLSEGKEDQARAQFRKDLSPRSGGRSEYFRINRRSREQLRKM